MHNTNVIDNSPFKTFSFSFKSKEATKKPTSAGITPTIGALNAQKAISKGEILKSHSVTLEELPDSTITNLKRVAGELGVEIEKGDIEDILPPEVVLTSPPAEG